MSGDPFASAFVAADDNPDEAARQDEVGRKLGVAREAVANDPSLLREDKARAAANALADAPASARWFDRNAPIAHDDADNLSTTERVWKAGGQTFRNVGRAYTHQNLQIGRLLGTETPIEGLKRRATAAEMEQERGIAGFEIQSLKSADPLAWALMKSGQDLVQLAGAAIETAPSTLETLALSAAIVVPGVGALGPTAAYTKAALGEAAQVFEVAVDQYNVPEDIARLVAFPAGGLIGGVEYLSTLTVAGKVLPTKLAAQREIRALIGKSLVKPGVLGAASRVAQGSAVEGGTEALQQVMADAGSLVAQLAAGQEPEVRVTIDGEEYTGLSAVLLSAIEAGKVGAVAGTGFAGLAEAPSAVKHSFAGARKRAEAAASQTTMDDVLKAADASKIRERSPDRYTEALKEQIVEQGVAQTVYVPAGKLKELFQKASEGDKAELERAHPGIAALAADAEATGADVAIPTEVFVGKVAHTALGKQLRKSWREDPDAMTAEEGAAEEERLVVEARGAPAETKVDPYAAYQREVEDQFVGAGEAPQRAKELGVLQRARLESQAERYQIPFDEALARFGLPEIAAARSAAVESGEKLAQRGESAESFDRNVAASMLTEARKLEPGGEVSPEQELQRDARTAFRQNVESLGLTINDPDAEILEALEAQAGDEFVAAQSESALFQRAPLGPTVAEIGPAKWLRGAELKGTRLLAKNIVAHFEKAPPTREVIAAAKAGAAKRGWYRRSMLAIQHAFGQDAPRFTALLAALSPQDSVQNNLHNALKVWNAWVKAKKPVDPDAIRNIINRVTTVSKEDSEGRVISRGEALQARVPNSITALTATTESLNDKTFKLSGPKVDSFWRNLTGDMDAVTLDSWMAVFFAIPKQKLGDSRSMYLALTAAVRKAADALTKQTGELWTPAEVQETIWSWAKALVEQRATPGEIRLAHEIVRQGGVDPARITSVPDFAGLLSSAVYAPLIEEIGIAGPVGELAEGTAGRAGEGAAPEAAAAAGVPERAPLERAARRVERVVSDRERASAAGLELAQRASVAETVERLRGLGLRVEVRGDKLAFVGHDGRAFSVDQIETPEGMKAFHEALGFPTDPTGRDTIEDLKVYRLKHVFGNTVEEVEAKLRPWLKKIGWKFKRFGPGTGPKGKPYWPNFRDPKTPSYADKTAFIFSEQVAEGSFFDPAYTLAWRVPHEVAHGITNPMMDARYGPGFRAGALGKVTRGPFFKEDVARTLTEALRATDWEVETFKEQRSILEREFGVDLTDDEFRKENAVNYTGALYRAITGQFADPNTVGVLPFTPDPDQLQALGRELLRAVAAERGVTLEQGPTNLPSGARGVTQFGESYTDPVRIILAKSANASTALHECWHVWFAQLEREATQPVPFPRPTTSAEIRAKAEAKLMWEAARKWIGAVPGAELTVRQREKLARAGEAYVREGRAPSLTLRETFARFASWIRGVYRTLRELERQAGQPLRLSDEMRTVLDRMLATDADIAEAKRARGFTPAADAAIVSLMTDDERADYEAKLAAVERATRERVAQKVHKIAKERGRANYDAAVAEIREVVTAGVNARRAVAARTWLTTGEWHGNGPSPDIQSAALDSAALEEMYGKVPARLPTHAVQRGGLHPDVAAEALGYTDGDSLVQDVAALGKEPTEKIIDREVRARVKAELDVADSYGREEIVHALAELPEHIDVLRSSERALARRAGAKVVQTVVVRRAAQRIVAETPVVQLSPHKFRAAAEREGAAVARFAGNGEWAEALAAKRRQQLNVFLESEASKAKEKADSNHDRLAWLDGPVASVTLVKAGHTYADQISSLLERFNLKRTPAKAIAKRQALASWYADRVAEGETPAIPDHIRDEAYTKNWRELTVAELQDVTDSANSIYSLARRKVEFSAAAVRRDRAEIRVSLVERLARATKIPKALESVDYDDPAASSLGKKILGLGAALDKIVAVVDHVDGGDTNGPFHTYVYRPIAEALGRKQGMTAEYAEKFHGLMSDLVKGKEAEYTARVVAPELPLTDEHGRSAPGRFSKLNMLAMALNAGNDSNWRKLIEGYGWTEDAVLSFLQRHLTREDWRFVQQSWDLIDTLWPAIAAQEEKLNGVTPDRVLPRETTVLSKDGFTVHLRGGYYPVVYDPGRSQWAYKNASRGLFEGVENHFMRAITGHGHTVSRTEVTGPLLLDVSVIPRHLDEVIHDLAFRATLLDVDVLLDNTDIKNAMTAALGRPYGNMFRPWLQSIAQDRTFAPKLMRPWEQMLKRIRLNATSSILFFRDTTLLAQLSGHSPAMAEMRAHLPEGWGEDYRSALGTAAHHPRRSAEFVRARSAFMRARIDNSDRDRRDQIRDLQSRAAPAGVTVKVWRKSVALGGAAIANTQFYGVDVPVWIAAYNAGQRLRGLNERDAGFFADQIVRLSQGSGESIDLSEMQRGTEWQKQFTTFYSYVASQWVTFVRDLRGLRHGKISFGEFGVRYALRFTLPAVYAMAVRALLTGKGLPDWEDEDSWDEAWWAVGATGIFDVASAIPVLRDAVGWVKYGRVSPTIPIARATQKVIEATHETARAVTDEVRPVELFTDIVTAIGMVTGLPVVRAADLVKELNEEDDQ
jgi:hypothetical protein